MEQTTKIILGVVIIVGAVYLAYSYNDAQNKLGYVQTGGWGPYQDLMIPWNFVYSYYPTKQ